VIVTDADWMHLVVILLLVSLAAGVIIASWPRPPEK